MDIRAQKVCEDLIADRIATENAFKQENINYYTVCANILLSHGVTADVHKLTEALCSRFRELFGALTSSGLRQSGSWQLPVIASLVTCDRETPRIVSDISDIVEYLKGKKGYKGIFGVYKKCALSIRLQYCPLIILPK